MSEEPAVPAKAPVPAVSSPVTIIERDITWIRGHVILALCTVALIAGSIIGGVYLFENLIEKHDARVAAAQQAKEGVDTSTVSTLMAQLAQDRTADSVRDAQQTALIQTLVSQMQQQHAATAKQVVTDSTLDAQDAASRLVSQTKASPSAVSVNGDAITMTLPMTRGIIVDLDQWAQATSDVTNLTAQLSAQQTLTGDATAQLADANKVIAADKTELIATIKGDNDACNVRVDKEAAKGRKRGFWAALGGFIGGALLGSRI
jgi:hypothetical protein